jgi:hypothetical protein
MLVACPENLPAKSINDIVVELEFLNSIKFALWLAAAVMLIGTTDAEDGSITLAPVLVKRLEVFGKVVSVDSTESSLDS